MDRGREGVQGRLGVVEGDYQHTGALRPHGAEVVVLPGIADRECTAMDVQVQRDYIPGLVAWRLEDASMECGAAGICLHESGTERGWSWLEQSGDCKYVRSPDLESPEPDEAIQTMRERKTDFEKLGSTLFVQGNQGLRHNEDFIE